MLVRLDRLDMPVKAKTCPDFSLLSAEDYDRVFEAVKNRDSFTEEEIGALLALVSELPTLGPGDSPKGPEIEVPRSLEHYWQWHLGTAGWRSYSFWKNLGKVETLRFLELCTLYGWEEGQALKERMVPLAEWSPDDRAEMTALLDKAGAPDDVNSSV
jgi:hypothetical protein